MPRTLLTFLAVLPAVAVAQVPQWLTYQGRLLKAGGTEPETGAKRLGFAIFDAATGGAALWSESQTLGLTDGYYSALLGGQVPLSAAALGGDRWLEISVDNTPLAPRQSIGSVPFALVASSVSGGRVSASSAMVTGSVGIATGSPAAQVHVVGSAAQGAGPGTVGINGVAYSTLAGTGTSFKQSGVAPGDVVVVTTTANTSYSRLVTEVLNDATLTVNAAYPAAFSGASYIIQKPVARFDGADGTPRLAVNGLGDVGVGTLTPAAKLDVMGTIKGGGVLAGTFYSAPTSAVSIKGSSPTYNSWADIADSALAFVLERPATVFVTYAISVQPSAQPGSEHVVTRLAVDGSPFRSTGAHYQPFCAGDCNVTLTGSLVLNLAAGSHSVSMQWMTYGNTITWSNDPAWCEGYCGARTITALAFHQ